MLCGGLDRASRLASPQHAVDATPIAPPQRAACTSWPLGDLARTSRYLAGLWWRSYGTVPMWRQTPEFGFSGTRRTAGKKKVSLTLNLEIRSLERRIFTYASRLIHWVQLSFLWDIHSDKIKSLQGFERELTISAIGRELRSPRSHAIRSNRQQSPRARQVARSRPPLQPTGKK